MFCASKGPVIQYICAKGNVWYTEIQSKAEAVSTAVFIASE